MVIISMMIMSNANTFIEYDGRKSGLPNALAVMKYGNNII